MRFVFRQFPLTSTRTPRWRRRPRSAPHAQGKFWEFHDSMFENQQALAVEQLKAKAASWA